MNKRDRTLVAHVSDDTHCLLSRLLEHKQERHPTPTTSTLLSHIITKYLASKKKENEGLTWVFQENHENQ